MTLCNHCGAEFSPGVNAACRDCGLAPDVAAVPTLPAGDEGGREDEIVFDVDAWPAGQRVAFGRALEAAEVPWRWEPGPVLVVRSFDEAVVDGLFEDAGIDDADWEDLTGSDAEEEADAAAQEAMSELFDAADRLVHSPDNGDIVDEVDGLAATIEESRPPFGIEPAAWERMASLAGAVVSAASAGQEESVAETARALRDYLRSYV